MYTLQTCNNPRNYISLFLQDSLTFHCSRLTWSTLMDSWLPLTFSVRAVTLKGSKHPFYFSLSFFNIFETLHFIKTLHHRRFFCHLLTRERELCLPLANEQHASEQCRNSWSSCRWKTGRKSVAARYCWHA